MTKFYGEKIRRGKLRHSYCRVNHRKTDYTFMKILLFCLLLGVTWSSWQADPLAAYRWKFRVLLVFAPRADATALAEQRRFIENKKTGFQDRDLVVLELTNGAKAEALRQQFSVKPEVFAVILIGKDGGEKLRQTKPVAPGELFDLIDSMPMRQREMRRQ